jgi:opacity protein-like surface antigen
MKKLVLSLMAICTFGFANAQKKIPKVAPVEKSYSSSSADQTAVGNWLIEANTGFGGDGRVGSGSTQFKLFSRDGSTLYGIGLEGGYFFMDDLAIKLGLGYEGSSESGSNSAFAYKIGAKYYVIRMIPVELSYTGVSVSGASQNPSYVGIQAGYAWFLGKNVSLEPGLRYNYALLSKDKGGISNLQFNIGFALHF